MKELTQRIKDWYVINMREPLIECWNYSARNRDYFLDERFMESSRRVDSRNLYKMRRAFNRVALRYQEA